VAYQLGLALVLVVVLPAAQEILFRGLLQPAMVRLWGSGRGIAFVSALNALAFGLLNPWAFAPTFTSSLVLGILRRSSSSLLPCLLLHALFGGATLLATHEFFRIPGFDDTSAPHTPMEWLGTAALLCGIGLGLCRAAATPRGPTLPAELPGQDH
jgi:membrane protease YdiL (CAAX protease family)